MTQLNAVLEFKLFVLLVLLLSACQTSDSSDWYKVPIESCIKTNEKLIGKTAKIANYCNCMVPKIHHLVKEDKAKLASLKQGDLTFLNKNPDDAYIEVMAECLPLKEDVSSGQRPAGEWLDQEKERGLIQSLKNQFKGTNFEKTNDHA